MYLFKVILSLILCLTLIIGCVNCIFFASKPSIPSCPPSHLFHPCECYLHADHMKIIRCGGHQSYDLMPIFSSLSAHLPNDDKHFHMFYLNNTAIQTLGNVFNDITFDYIYFDGASSLQSIDAKTFEITGPNVKEVRAFNTKLKQSSLEESVVGLSNLLHLTVSNVAQCPPEELLRPCRCEHRQEEWQWVEAKFTRIICGELREEDLRSVYSQIPNRTEEQVSYYTMRRLQIFFERLSENLNKINWQKRFDEFILQNSPIAELPRNIFNDIIFYGIRIDNCPKLTTIHPMAFTITAPFVQELLIRRTKLANDRFKQRDIFNAITSLENLRALYLHWSGLMSIPHHAFRPLKGKFQRKLVKVSVKYTKSDRTALRMIGSYAFYYLSNLKTIDLSLNSIVKVYRNAFSLRWPSTEALEIILAGNNLTENSLDPQAFLEAQRPVHVVLGQGILTNPHLHRLDERVFRLFLKENSKNKVKLYSSKNTKGLNRISCDCQSKWMFDEVGRVRNGLEDIMCKSNANITWECLPPCLVFGHDLLHCGSNQLFDIRETFYSLTNKLLPHERHFKRFVLSNTQIESLPANSFANITFEHLEFDGCSQLRTIDERAFVNIEDKVQRIVVRQTRELSKSKTNQLKFSLFKNLTHLDLSFDGEFRLFNNTFETDINSNKTLYIRLNRDKIKAQSIEMNAFNSAKRPIHLFFDSYKDVFDPIGCQLMKLEEEIYAYFLASNPYNQIHIMWCPIVCDCSIKWLFDAPKDWWRRVDAGDSSIGVQCADHRSLYRYSDNEFRSCPKTNLLKYFVENTSTTTAVKTTLWDYITTTVRTTITTTSSPTTTTTELTTDYRPQSSSVAEIFTQSSVQNVSLVNEREHTIRLTTTSTERPDIITTEQKFKDSFATYLSVSTEPNIISNVSTTTESYSSLSSVTERRDVITTTEKIKETSETTPKVSETQTESPINTTVIMTTIKPEIKSTEQTLDQSSQTSSKFSETTVELRTEAQTKPTVNSDNTTTKLIVELKSTTEMTDIMTTERKPDDSVVTSPTTAIKLATNDSSVNTTEPIALMTSSTESPEIKTTEQKIKESSVTLMGIIETTPEPEVKVTLITERHDMITTETPKEIPLTSPNITETTDKTIAQTLSESIITLSPEIKTTEQKLNESPVTYSPKIKETTIELKTDIQTKPTVSSENKITEEIVGSSHTTPLKMTTTTTASYENITEEITTLKSTEQSLYEITITSSSKPNETTIEFNTETPINATFISDNKTTEPIDDIKVNTEKSETTNVQKSSDNYVTTPVSQSETTGYFLNISELTTTALRERPNSIVNQTESTFVVTEPITRLTTLSSNVPEFQTVSTVSPNESGLRLHSTTDMSPITAIDEKDISMTSPKVSVSTDKFLIQTSTEAITTLSPEVKAMEQNSVTYSSKFNETIEELKTELQTKPSISTDIKITEPLVELKSTTKIPYIITTESKSDESIVTLSSTSTTARLTTIENLVNITDSTTLLSTTTERPQIKTTELKTYEITVDSKTETQTKPQISSDKSNTESIIELKVTTEESIITSDHKSSENFLTESMTTLNPGIEVSDMKSDENSPNVSETTVELSTETYAKPNKITEPIVEFKSTTKMADIITTDRTPGINTDTSIKLTTPNINTTELVTTMGSEIKNTEQELYESRVTSAPKSSETTLNSNTESQTKAIIMSENKITESDIELKEKLEITTEQNSIDNSDTTLGTTLGQNEYLVNSSESKTTITTERSDETTEPMTRLLSTNEPEIQTTEQKTKEIFSLSTETTVNSFITTESEHNLSSFTERPNMVSVTEELKDSSVISSTIETQTNGYVVNGTELITTIIPETKGTEQRLVESFTTSSVESFVNLESNTKTTESDLKLSSLNASRGISTTIDSSAKSSVTTPNAMTERTEIMSTSKTESPELETTELKSSQNSVTYSPKLIETTVEFRSETQTKPTVISYNKITEPIIEMKSTTEIPDITTDQKSDDIVISQMTSVKPVTTDSLVNSTEPIALLTTTSTEGPEMKTSKSKIKQNSITFSEIAETTPEPKSGVKTTDFATERFDTITTNEKSTEIPVTSPKISETTDKSIIQTSTQVMTTSEIKTTHKLLVNASELYLTTETQTKYSTNSENKITETAIDMKAITDNSDITTDLKSNENFVTFSAREPTTDLNTERPEILQNSMTETQNIMKSTESSIKTMESITQLIKLENVPQIRTTEQILKESFFTLSPETTVQPLSIASFTESESKLSSVTETNDKITANNNNFNDIPTVSETKIIDSIVNTTELITTLKSEFKGAEQTSHESYTTYSSESNPETTEVRIENLNPIQDETTISSIDITIESVKKGETPDSRLIESTTELQTNPTQILTKTSTETNESNEILD